jgi:membrane protein implicated in regulation of membrane protease activity
MSIWHWAALGLLLGIAELFTGTAYLLWLGVAAFCTAGISWLFPELGLAWQASIFAFLAVAATTSWFLRNKYHTSTGKSVTLNQRAQLLMGRKLTLVENMHDFRGHVMIDGVLWRIKAPENYTAGTVVEIRATEGTLLVVHAI